VTNAISILPPYGGSHKALLFLSQRLLKTLTIQDFTNQIVKDQSSRDQPH